MYSTLLAAHSLFRWLVLASLLYAIWFTIGLLIMLSSIPWAFSPLVSRPYFRGF